MIDTFGANLLEEAPLLNERLVAEAPILKDQPFDWYGNNDEAAFIDDGTLTEGFKDLETLQTEEGIQVQPIISNETNIIP